MKIFDLLALLARPAVRIFVALVAPVTILLGTIANPSGAVNSLIVRLIDWIAVPWPSTPEELKLANLIFPAVGGISIGRAVAIEIFTTAFLMLTIILIVKLYKLIPFKAT